MAPIAGGTINGTLTLVNAGYGRVIRKRPVSLVLLSNGSVLKQTALSTLDLRTLASSAGADVASLYLFAHVAVDIAGDTAQFSTLGCGSGAVAQHATVIRATV